MKNPISSYSLDDDGIITVELHGEGGERTTFAVDNEESLRGVAGNMLHAAESLEIAKTVGVDIAIEMIDQEGSFEEGFDDGEEPF